MGSAVSTGDGGGAPTVGPYEHAQLSHSHNQSSDHNSNSALGTNSETLGGAVVGGLAGTGSGTVMNPPQQPAVDYGMVHSIPKNDGKGIIAGTAGFGAADVGLNESEYHNQGHQHKEIPDQENLEAVEGKGRKEVDKKVF